MDHHLKTTIHHMQNVKQHLAQREESAHESSTSMIHDEDREHGEQHFAQLEESEESAHESSKSMIHDEDRVHGEEQLTEPNQKECENEQKECENQPMSTKDIMHEERNLAKPMSEYYHHLLTLAGGNCTAEAAQKQVNGCNAILQLLQVPLDKCDRIISDIIDSKYKDKQWKPNTCKTYLDAVIRYIKFLANSCKLREMYNIPALYSVKDTLQRLCASLHSLAKSERKARLKAQSVHSEKRLTPLLTPCIKLVFDKNDSKADWTIWLTQLYSQGQGQVVMMTFHNR
jgi:hypothetical protein